MAVQFTTHVAQPSSARRQRAGGRMGEAEEEGEVEGPRGSTLCTLPEPHDHIFYVPNELVRVRVRFGFGLGLGSGLGLVR